MVITISFHVVELGLQRNTLKSVKIRENYKDGKFTGLFKSASVKINFNETRCWLPSLRLRWLGGGLIGYLYEG